jgi:ABC-type nitrate/sulfonate/bicarbonate transport system substrate-binding protein
LLISLGRHPKIRQFCRFGVELGIDAAFLWGDATNQATTIPGVTILSDDKPALVRSYGYMLTSNQFAAQNPKAVENSLRALAKAVQWMEANPAEAATLMAGHAKAPLEVIKAQMPLQHYTVSLTQPQLDAFNRIAEFSAANKVTRVKVEPRKFIDTSFLKKVDAKRVTLGD